MKLDLNRLYNYIYGDWADVDKHVKQDLPADVREKAIQKKKKEINEFFSETKLKLRPYIREQKNSHLENILFGDDIAEVSDPNRDGRRIDSKEITNEFLTKEGFYGLLKDEKDNIPPQAIHMFNIYYAMARMIGKALEDDQDRHGHSIIVHAYKLLVVFGTDPANYFGSIDKYLVRHNFLNTANKPLHDALVPVLPVSAGKKNRIHLSDWQALIQKEGPRLFKLFNIAHAIEEYLGGRCPKDLAEARDAVKNLKYKNAKEAPALADLFIEHNLDERIFNNALAVEIKKKSADYLPKIEINGSDISADYANYYFVKLPIHDLNAYVLGELTHCCQSMGGHSEQCVIDGLTLLNNGFYVLLKKIKSPQAQEKKAAVLSPLIQGKINYRFFEIVGQGYAWLSKKGNLVFDSWENKNSSPDDKIIVPFLEKFSQIITQQPDSTIMRVMIGIGGKTPVGFRVATCKYPEVMREGEQYGDSRVQSTIYCNDAPKKAAYSSVKECIETILAKQEMKSTTAMSVDDVAEWLVGSCFSKAELASLKSSVADLSPQNISLLLSNKNIVKIPFELAKRLVKAEILNDVIINMISFYKNDAEAICTAFIVIKNAGFVLNPNVIEHIAQCSYPISKAREIISYLEELKTEQFDQYQDVLDYCFEHRLRLEWLLVCKTALTVLKKADVVHSAVIRGSIYSQSSDNMLENANNIAIAINKIRHASCEINDAVCNVVAYRYYNNDEIQYIIKILTRLKNEKFIHYLDVQEEMLQMSVGYGELDEFIFGLRLLDEAGLLQCDEIRKATIKLKYHLVFKAAKDKVLANTMLQEAKVDHQLRIDILAAGASLNIAQAFVELKVTNLEKDHCRMVFLACNPKRVLSQLLILKEAKLENDVDLRSCVGFERDTEEFLKHIEASKLLKEYQLENILNIKYWVAYASNPLEKVKFYRLLKEANFENNVAICYEINARCMEEKNVLELIVALNIFRDAGLYNNDSNVFINRILDSTEPVAIAKAFVALKMAGLYTDDSIVLFVTAFNYSAKKINDLIAAFFLLKEVELDQVEVVKVFIAKSSKPLEDVKIILQLNKENLLADILIRNHVCCHQAGSEYGSRLIRAFELLNKANLNKEEEVRSLVKNSLQPERIAQEIIAKRCPKEEKIPPKPVSIVVEKKQQPAVINKVVKKPNIHGFFANAKAYFKRKLTKKAQLEKQIKKQIKKQ